MTRPLPPLRLGDLRDLTDAELRRHIFVSYMRPGTDTVRDECDACGGTGEQVGPDPFQSLCPACDGDGRVVRYATELEASSDAELAQRIGNVLVAYESVGMWGCDSAAYFVIERDGELYEVRASHDSTCGFEGQWEPRPVTPGYLVSEHWGMSIGGYDEHRDRHPAWDCESWDCESCEGEGYVFTEDGYAPCRMCDGSGRQPDAPASDVSTRDLVMLWLHHRFAGDLAALPLVMPEWAIPKRALHVDKQGNAIDLRTVDDRYLLNIVRWACRKVRKHWREEQYVYVINTVPQQRVVMVGQHDAVSLAQAVACQTVDLIAAVPSDGVVAVCTERGRRVDTLRVEHRAPAARGSFINAMREAEARGLVPTLEQLAVAWDLAGCRGHVDQRTGEPVSEVGPWDLVDLWVGYVVRGGEA